MLRTFVAVICLATLPVPVLDESQALAQVADAAARPASAPVFTSGEVALFVLSVKDIEVQRNLTLALRDANADVRAVAARVAAVTGSKAQIPALLRALPGESDGLAGGEIVRALLALQGSAVDAFVLPHVLRIGFGAARVYGEVLARVRPDRFLAALPQLVAIAGMADETGRLAALAIRHHPDRASEVGAALVATGSEVAFGVLLLDPSTDEAFTATVLAGLQGGGAAIRERAVWHVAERLMRGETVADALVDAVRAPPDTPVSAGGPLSWEAFGRELVARSRGRKAGPDIWSDVIRRHPDDARRLAWSLDSDWLTKDERVALEALETDAMREARAARPRPSRPPDPRAASRPSPATLRWAVPGLGASVLQATGCRPHSASTVYAEVEYKPEGTIARASTRAAPMSPECIRAAQAAVSLSTAAPHRPIVAGERHPVLVVLDADVLACASDWSGDCRGPPPRRVGSKPAIVPPKKTRNVNPVYPVQAQNEGIQGVVILEATITPRGCVTDVSIIQSIPELDEAAINAVLQWRYTPTLLDGEPVPVIMTVTTNFTLRR